MKNLDLFFERAMIDVEEAGIVPGNIVKVEINTRAKSRWGQAKYEKYSYDWNKCKYSINISSVLLDEHTPDYGLEETLIHEILHTCENCMDHKKTWNKYVDIMNKKYGYHIKRTDSPEDKGIDSKSEFYLKSAYKYRLTCKQCGKVYYRNRLDYDVKYYSCNKCKGKLKLEILH